MVVHACCSAKMCTCCVPQTLSTTRVLLGPLLAAVSYQAESLPVLKDRNSAVTSGVGTSVDLAGRTHKSGSSLKGAKKGGSTVSLSSIQRGQERWSTTLSSLRLGQDKPSLFGTVPTLAYHCVLSLVDFEPRMKVQAARAWIEPCISNRGDNSVASF